MSGGGRGSDTAREKAARKLWSGGRAFFHSQWRRAPRAEFALPIAALRFSSSSRTRTWCTLTTRSACELSHADSEIQKPHTSHSWQYESQPLPRKKWPLTTSSMMLKTIAARSCGTRMCGCFGRNARSRRNQISVSSCTMK